ncbi:hypothetical protein GCM10010327_05230 [Streptomyces nitrosporeus]|nr:hypothetical protein GCM10010327_05230 [Streptomyces nitrosporeus]
MLVLAVAAGESGVNPELSRNGMTGVLSRTRKSEDLPAARPARPNRTPYVRASRKAGGRRARYAPAGAAGLPGCPCPRRPRAERGQPP